MVITAVLVLAWHQGYRVWVVHTGSMIPTFRPGEAIVDQPVHGWPQRGEIITFRYASGPDQVVTHRVYRESGGTIRTKGDANPTEDPWTLHASQVVGTPTAIIPDGGYLIVYLSQPTGAASVVTFTITITLLWGLCFPGHTEDAAGAQPGAGAQDAPEGGPENGAAAGQPSSRARQASWRASRWSGSSKSTSSSSVMPRIRLATALRCRCRRCAVLMMDPCSSR